MELGPLVADFKPPPHPKGISLDGKLVQLVPMEAEEHAEALFEANQLDTEGTNWAYLPYGPFADLKSYHSWVRENQDLEDPVFLAIVEKTVRTPPWDSQLSADSSCRGLHRGRSHSFFTPPATHHIRNGVDVPDDAMGL